MVHQLAFGIVMGGIGVIALAGIIVSNNIILIDTFDEKIRLYTHKVKSSPPLDVIRRLIIETGHERLRPVMLTKLTAILGLLPIMFGINIDFFAFDITYGAPSTQWWILLSTCIVYGLLFASSLTLFFTPAALMWRAQRQNITDATPLLAHT
jgi:multidrug efflux pump